MSPSSDILIRGDEAARARPVDLVETLGPAPLEAVGPWADAIADDRSVSTDRCAAARQEGYEVGRQQAFEESARNHEELVTAVNSLLAEIEERAEELGRRLAIETTELALEIAAAVIGREVTVAANPGADAIARCLELAPPTGDLVAHLHPDDAARLGDVAVVADRTLNVVTDRTLQRGDAVVTVEDTTIENRLASSLERVAEVLR